jgi:predicted negative regulator of RcsB-dependent stress response
MAAVFAAIEAGDATAAERQLRMALERDRDQAIAQLADIRSEHCDPNRLLHTAQ